MIVPPVSLRDQLEHEQRKVAALVRFIASLSRGRTDNEAPRS